MVQKAALTSPIFITMSAWLPHTMQEKGLALLAIMCIV
jgi:hypothetical protein